MSVEEKPGTLDYLRQRLVEVRHSLSKAAPKLFLEMAALEDAISAVERKMGPQFGEYTRFRSGIDALVAYLKQHGPTERKVAMKAVIAGGWAASDENAFWKLLDAVRHQLETSNRPRIIALGEDRIGLPEHRTESETEQAT